MSINDPQGGTSNVRSIAIFTSYILLCLGLTIFILHTLYLKTSFSTSKQQARSVSSAKTVEHVKLFAALAILSLGTTWYYMLCFFSLSYRSWAFTHVAALGGDRQQLGLWLKETQLFKEAWGTAAATPARFWWTQQVFFFSAAWSVFLGREGHRRSIPHLWAFMLLGQVAAISFASNLFFLAVLRSPPLRQAREHNIAAAKPLTWTWTWTWTPPLILHAAPIAITIISVGLMPYFSESSHFLTNLLVPHLLLFVPPLLYRIVPRSWGKECISSEECNRYYSRIYRTIYFFALLLQAKVTVDALGQPRGIWGIFEALYEHPAVSSVGWDVILCAVSWCMWALTKQWETAVSEAKRGAEIKERVKSD